MDDPARTAPGSPEVDQHRLLGLEHLGLEGAVGHVGELPGHFSSPDARCSIVWLPSSAARGVSPSADANAIQNIVVGRIAIPRRPRAAMHRSDAERRDRRRAGRAGDAVRARRGDPVPRPGLSRGGSRDPPEPGLGGGAGAGRPGHRAARRRRDARAEDPRAARHGRDPGRGEAEAEVPAVAGRGDHGSRGSARRPRAASTTSSASRASTTCAPPPSRSGSASSRASARRPRRTCSPRSASWPTAGPRSDCCSPRCCRSPSSWRPTCAPIRPATRSRSRARPGGEPRPATTST